jgi:hypothetical protein
MRSSGSEPDEPDWDDEESMIVPEQPATFVYWNPRGQLVIRQKGQIFEDDPYVIFTVEYLQTLIAALKQKLRDLDSTEALAEPHEAKAKAANRQAPLSAAERQRRFRQRRNEQSNVDALRGDEIRTSSDDNSLPGHVTVGQLVRRFGEEG